jgi:hypothetical protein
MARLLARMPDGLFSELLHAVSYWFETHASYLPRPELWALWDRVATIALAQEAVGHG